MAIKIFIDQGHNPQNPNAGAEGNGLREQDITYAIGIQLANLLRADQNFEVRLSRNSASEVLGTSNLTSLQARVNAANNWGADAFLSLHTNASDNASAGGAEAYVYRTDSAAGTLAGQVLSSLVDATGQRNRGVFARPSLYVLRKTSMPAVLLEMGFITNPGDAFLMSEDPELFARGIYRGLRRYYGLA